MKHIRLLDNTLRDGGYLNDWRFGYDTIIRIFDALVQANIDIIEVGLINSGKQIDFNRTINPNIEVYNEMFSNSFRGDSIIVGMIKFGTCNIECVSIAENSLLDGIRVYFQKEELGDALEFCSQLKSKGYKVFVNPVGITSYTDLEIMNLVELVNNLAPYSLTIVDTFGLLNGEKLAEIFNLMDKNLEPEICIGFHGHNNEHSALENSITFANLRAERSLIIDSSLYGIGRAQGNCPTEELVKTLEGYDREPLEKVIEGCLKNVGVCDNL